MIGKTPRVHLMTFLEVALERFIDMNHELVQLSKAIGWAEVESEFPGYYCSANDRPSVPIRKMVCLLAAAAYNLRHWMNKLSQSSFVFCLLVLVRRLKNMFFEKQQR